MNYVATILGISLPTLSAKSVAMRCPPPKVPEPVCLIWGNHRDSMLLMNKTQDNADDETATTLCTSDSDLSFSGSAVTFAETLVTEVRHRPYTTVEEKYTLFYNDLDFADFRRECYSGKRRSRLVSFADSIVSEVHVVPVIEDSGQMFYTEAELQEFLDEFVASLDKGFGFD